MGIRKRMFLQLPLDFACCGVVAGYMKGLVLVFTVDLAPQPGRSFFAPSRLRVQSPAWLESAPPSAILWDMT
jgi:hypothetical protein